MSNKIIARPLQMLALSACLVSTVAVAQDFGGILKSVFQNKTTDMFKSATDLTLGRVMQGVQEPADSEGKVVLFSTPWCGYCKSAIAYMEQKNIPYVNRNIENNPINKADYTRLGGKGGVPFIVFDGKTLSGFSESAFERQFAEGLRLAAVQKGSAAGTTVGATNPNTAATGAAPSIFQAGDTLVGKIPGVKVYAQASKNAQPLMALAKTEEVVYMGEENLGLYRVTSARGEGWVDKLLVKKP
jgi:glutaredoxin